MGTSPDRRIRPEARLYRVSIPLDLALGEHKCSLGRFRRGERPQEVELDKRQVASLRKRGLTVIPCRPKLEV